MRSTLLAVSALAFLRIVVGMHFFLEGLSHLRDPDWSSAGFRKAAVGPLADFFRASLPETGNWSVTLGTPDGRPLSEASADWKTSVVAGWKQQLAEREKIMPLDAAGRADAEQRLSDATSELDDFLAGISEDLSDYRLQKERLAAMERSPAASDVPFVRDRVAKKRRELGAQSTGWMKDAAAIGEKLVAEWDEPRSATDRRRLDAAAGPSSLWRADRFVSWSLVTIGACLVLGLGVKFNAMGGVCFLASVLATQPFWVTGAQPTYNQWVELTALLAIASLPTGGWSGLDFFLGKWLGNFCPLSGCCRTDSHA
jgi:uncharacterized membrane protein YphA (DoxX/SURF4 family)